MRRCLIHLIMLCSISGESIHRHLCLNPAGQNKRHGDVFFPDFRAKRIEKSIQDAVAKGGRLLCGGSRDGRLVQPAVLEAVPHDAEASCEEILVESMRRMKEKRPRRPLCKEGRKCRPGDKLLVSLASCFASAICV